MRSAESPVRAVGHRGRSGASRGTSTQVAVTVDAVRPLVGSVHRQFERLIPLLRARGVRMTVVDGGLAWRGPRPAPVGQTKVVRIPGPRCETTRSLSFAALGAAWIVRDLPHVVHARGMCAAATAAMLGTQLIRRPYVVTVVGAGAHGDVAHLQATRGGRRRLDRLVRTAATFVCASRGGERELLELGVDRSRVVRISDGVDIERFRPRRLDEPAPGVARASLGLPAGDPLTVAVGRLEPGSRIDRVIEAHATVPGTLLIVGRGSQEPRLRRLARTAGIGDRVVIRPPGDDVAPLLGCADAFVTCADHDGPPSAVLEAMASGLPVVASGDGELAELVDASTGVLVRSTAPGDLGRATAALLADRPRRDALGVAGRQRVVADHTLTRTADELAALYRGIRR